LCVKALVAEEVTIFSHIRF